MQDSSIATPSRSLRYSGSERPAWRMNHTGVCLTLSPRAARRNGEEARSGWEVRGGERGSSTGSSSQSGRARAACRYPDAPTPA